MTTTAELQQQLADVQARIVELRLKYENNRNDFLQAQREFFAAGAALRADPDNTALQQAQIDAQANFEQVAAEVKPVTAELNASLAQEKQLQQQITATAQTNAKEQQNEETTINPKSDPTVSRDVQSLIDKRNALELENQAAIAAGNRALSDSLVDQINAIDEQIQALDPDYRGGFSVDTGGGTGGDTTNDNANINNDSIIEPVQESAIGPAAPDWRFRMSLSPYADYLYMADNPGILAPLVATNGVIFPYSPSITLTYVSNYNAQDITHSNYKIYTYKNSAVETITISADFTAQDIVEANYLLAVIHFFRSVTKMFYGQDSNPSRGVPPPLVYLSGFGQYQFDWHPVVISSFTHTFPQDVDYIDAYPTNNGLSIGSRNLSPYETNKTNAYSNTERLRSISRQIQPGGLPPPPVFTSTQNINESTRVPTKITLQLSCLPIVTRNAISNKFSLKEYATGRLMRGSVNPGTGGGIW